MLCPPRVSRENPQGNTEDSEPVHQLFLLSYSRFCGEFSCPAPAAVATLRHRPLPTPSGKTKGEIFFAVLPFPSSSTFIKFLEVDSGAGERLPSHEAPACCGPSQPPLPPLARHGFPTAAASGEGEPAWLRRLRRM